jgi:hypothetical protein
MKRPYGSRRDAGKMKEPFGLRRDAGIAEKYPMARAIGLEGKQELGGPELLYLKEP